LHEVLLVACLAVRSSIIKATYTLLNSGIKYITTLAGEALQRAKSTIAAAAVVDVHAAHTD